MAEEAYGGVGRTGDSQEPWATSDIFNIRTFLISLTRGCLANFYNDHVARGASGAVTRFCLHGVQTIAGYQGMGFGYLCLSIMQSTNDNVIFHLSWKVSLP